MPNDDALCSQFRERPMDWRPAQPVDLAQLLFGWQALAGRVSPLEDVVDERCAELLIDRDRQCRVDLHAANVSQSSQHYLSSN